MTMDDRGMHPDLLEEALAEQEAVQDAPQAPEPRGRRGGRARAQSAPAATPEAPAEAPESDASSPTSGEAPDWQAQVREAFERDPIEAYRLLNKNLPRDVIEKDDVISGLVGHKADAMLRARQQAELERQKHEAAERGDLYSLGEMTQRELQEQQAALQAQQQQGNGTFMDGVVLFQQTLDPTIQEKVAGKTFGAGKGQAAGVAEYLQFIVDERAKLAEAEFQRRESALRKSILSEVNGDEPVPERESGTPGRVREVTDEQIEAMTMQEYNALFDEAGRPKPGVRHRATRGIPLTQR